MRKRSNSGGDGRLFDVASLQDFKRTIQEFKKPLPIISKSSPISDHHDELFNDGDINNNEMINSTMMNNIEQFKPNDIKIIDKIASGGFAEVFQIEISSKIYAGKRMLKNRAQLQRNIDKFTNELLKMKQISEMGCKNILKLIGYCFDRENQNYWIITEFINFGDLYSIINCKQLKVNSENNRILNNYSPLVELIHNDLTVKIKLCLEIAKCIDELHTLTNYAHLDIKSLNILIDENLEIRVGDWCDAKLIDLTKENQLTSFQAHGTIYWMAPEIVNHSLFCQKSDIYSLAIVFTELLILGKPYPGLNVLDVKQKLEESSVNGNVPFRMNIVEILENKGIEISNQYKNFISLIQDMWKQDVSERLSSTQVVERLNTLLME